MGIYTTHLHDSFTGGFKLRPTYIRQVNANDLVHSSIKLIPNYQPENLASGYLMAT